MRAKVTGRTDSGEADRFEDEHGYEWVRVTDDMHTTIAVNRCDGHRAGVFRWDTGSTDTGELWECREGEEYDVGNPGEFIVRNGEWVGV